MALTHVVHRRSVTQLTYLIPATHLFSSCCLRHLTVGKLKDAKHLAPRRFAHLCYILETQELKLSATAAQISITAEQWWMPDSFKTVKADTLITCILLLLLVYILTTKGWKQPFQMYRIFMYLRVSPLSQRWSAYTPKRKGCQIRSECPYESEGAAKDNLAPSCLDGTAEVPSLSSQDKARCKFLLMMLN
jgi:hypothetical protein